MNSVCTVQKALSFVIRPRRLCFQLRHTYICFLKGECNDDIHYVCEQCYFSFRGKSIHPYDYLYTCARTSEIIRFRSGALKIMQVIQLQYTVVT